MQTLVPHIPVPLAATMTAAHPVALIACPNLSTLQRQRIIIAMTLAAEAGQPCPVQVCPLADTAHLCCLLAK